MLFHIREESSIGWFEMQVSSSRADQYQPHPNIHSALWFAGEVKPACH
jgi:hypothetical protein